MVDTGTAGWIPPEERRRGGGEVDTKIIYLQKITAQYWRGYVTDLMLWL